MEKTPTIKTICINGEIMFNFPCIKEPEDGILQHDGSLSNQVKKSITLTKFLALLKLICELMKKAPLDLEKVHSNLSEILFY